jgi:hypothetical protein
LRNPECLSAEGLYQKLFDASPMIQRSRQSTHLMARKLSGRATLALLEAFATTHFEFGSGLGNLG